MPADHFWSAVTHQPERSDIPGLNLDISGYRYWQRKEVRWVIGGCESLRNTYEFCMWERAREREREGERERERKIMWWITVQDHCMFLSGYECSFSSMWVCVCGCECMAPQLCQCDVLMLWTKSWRSTLIHTHSLTDPHSRSLNHIHTHKLICISYLFQLEVDRLWFFNTDTDYWRTRKSRYRLIGRFLYIYL